MPAEQIVDLDETGMDNNETRAYGWGPRGEPCWGEKPGHRTQRVSLIDALHHRSSSRRSGSRGPAPRHSLKRMSEHCLVPVLKPGQMVIYDNAGCHQSATARRLIAGAGARSDSCRSYSPDLNPIEHDWFPLKQRIRKPWPLYARDLHRTMDAVLTQQPAP